MNDRPTAAKGHMPFPSHRSCAETMDWTPAYKAAPSTVDVEIYRPVEPKNRMLRQEGARRAAGYGW